MMERLQTAGVKVQLLRTQYRMHPTLASWPSATFYGNQLLSHPRPADRQPPKGARSLKTPLDPSLSALWSPTLIFSSQLLACFCVRCSCYLFSMSASRRPPLPSTVVMHVKKSPRCSVIDTSVYTASSTIRHFTHTLHHSVTQTSQTRRHCRLQ